MSIATSYAPRPIGPLHYIIAKLSAMQSSHLHVVLIEVEIIFRASNIPLTFISPSTRFLDQIKYLSDVYLTHSAHHCRPFSLHPIFLRWPFPCFWRLLDEVFRCYGSTHGVFPTSPDLSLVTFLCFFL